MKFDDVSVKKDDINENDVLCGRGGKTNTHPGNIYFREQVNKLRKRYKDSGRTEKPTIAKEVVDTIRKLDPPGRFLKQDKKTGLYNDIGDAEAIIKHVRL